MNPAPTRETTWISTCSYSAAARPRGRPASGGGGQKSLHAGLLLQLVHVGADLLLALARRQPGADLLLRLVERDRPLRSPLGDLDDVEAPARLDHVAALPGLQREGDPLDRRRPLALDEQPGIASPGGLRALRVPAGENRKVAAGSDLLEDCLDLLAGLGAGLGGGVRREAHDDLPQTDRLAPRHLRGVLVV